MMNQYKSVVANFLVHPVNLNDVVLCCISAGVPVAIPESLCLPVVVVGYWKMED